ncbi:FHA domain-containing protein [Clostridium perfringens]|nr:FHA domain-containing protein [Clostridium perfringens]
MSREVRICELCGTVNEPNNSECCNIDCGEDLAFVSITVIEDKEVPGNQEENNIKEDSLSNINCASNIYNQPLTENFIRKRTMVLASKSIRNKVDGKSIEIPFEGCILGRDGDVEVEYFQQFPFISNSHASFEYNCDELMIKDEGSTNGTKVNGEKLIPGKALAINEGDAIRLANIEFIVE